MDNDALLFWSFILSMAVLTFSMTVMYAVFRAANEVREYFERENRKHRPRH